MIDHIGYEVSDLQRSGRVDDVLFFALGVRRLHENEHVIGWGVTEPAFWLTRRSPPQPGYGHVAFRASGKAAVDAAHAAATAAGGSDDGTPGRARGTVRATTRATSGTRTGCASRSSRRTRLNGPLR